MCWTKWASGLIQQGSYAFALRNTSIKLNDKLQFKKGASIAYFNAQMKTVFGKKNTE